MRRTLAALFFSLLALTASAADWPHDYDAALARAAAEHKPLLVHFRSSCNICNRTADKDLARAETHAPILTLYDSFVRVRLSEDAAPKLAAQRPPSPSMLIVDPGGTLIVDFKRTDDLNRYLTFLNTAAASSPAIAESSALRVAGKTADADHLLGAVLLSFSRLHEAINAFERAVEQYEKAGDSESAQLASIHADYVRCLGSEVEKNRGISALLRATSSSSKVIAATAWVSIAGVRREEGDRRGAIKAFRKVLELMPADSPVAISARRDLEKLDDHPISSADAATVAIEKPGRASITGRALFAVHVNGKPSRVELFLDDKRVQTFTVAPYEARIDVGNVPRSHSIKAIAYDGSGNPMGEAVTTINDRADAPRVTLVSPVTDFVSGSINVEADAQVPAGRTLKSVELFWNEARLAKFDKPPFRVGFEAPQSFGYFRAVETLDDGTTAEDARVVNAGSTTAQVDVHAIAFVATVVDRDGKQIGGLKPNDFVIRDEGNPVNATIRESPDDLVTIGLVIDASGSMETSLMKVLEMTSQFLDVTVDAKDKVFLAAFESAPWLLHPPSSDKTSLKRALLSIRPSGSTATVDGIAFGLQQFSGMTGKRALVVITDGREGASSQSADAAIHLAKDTGIPVYGVVTTGQRTGNPLVNIAAATGGTIFYAPRPEEIVPMFRQIRDEVRGQYLISFVAQDRGKPGDWRKLTVDVPGKEAKVRTVSGYFAR